MSEREGAIRMAKDDYHVIVYRILAYLYACVKSGEPVDMEYLTYGTKAFPVNESYWSYIITTLAESGYVRGVCFIPVLEQGGRGIKAWTAHRSPLPG